jgi:iron(III) transport system substrate-binding protein
VNHSVQSSARLAAIVTEEVRAGRVTYDVVTCATPGLFYELLAQGALMRYVSPEYRFYTGSRKAGLSEEPGYWVSPWAYTFVIAWNPRIVQDEFRSWRDILKPAYRGRIVMGDPMRSLTYLDSYLGLRKVLDEGYFRQLADLQPFFLVRSEDIMSRVVSGEYPLAFFGMPTRAYQAARLGVEIRVAYPQEGAVPLGMPWIIMARAPHPNAAKLWIDFIFGKAGHQLYIINEALSTGREDIQLTTLQRTYTPPVGEIRAIPMDWKNVTESMRATAQDEFRRIFRR